jgi:YVTN family beta-propeller protein
MKRLRLLGLAAASAIACRAADLNAPQDTRLAAGPSPTADQAPSTDPFAAYISDAGTNSVLVVGQTSHTTISVIPIGDVPGVSASSPDGKRVYVILGAVQQLAVIRTSDYSLLAKIPLGGTGASGVVVSPDNKTVYVANRGGTISVVDATTLQVGTPIAVSGISPFMLDVTPDGKHLYVGDNSGNHLALVNTTTASVDGIISVGNLPYGVSATADGQFVYTGNRDGSVSKVRTSTNTVDVTLGLPGTPYGLAASPDNQHVFVAMHERNSVRVISIPANQVTAAVTVANALLVKVTADGRWVYVTEPESGLITILDAQTNAVSATIPVGNPAGITFAPTTPPSQPTTTAVVSSTQPSVTGQTVTYTATITSNGTPVTSGLVTFRLGGTACVDAATFAGPVTLDANGKATASRSFAASTTPYAVRACYVGPTTPPFMDPSEGAVMQTVNAAPTTATIVSSPQPSIAGQGVQFTATVTSGGTPVTAGQVSFRLGGTSCADATTFAGPVSLDVNGKAVTSRMFTASGSPFVVRVCYDGATSTGQYSSSEGAVTQTVTPAVTTTAITSSAQPSITGQTVQFTAIVTSGGTAITVGQITFKLGGTSCADATMFAGPVSLDANGKATTSRAFTASGSPFTVRACYDGATSGSLYSSSEGAVTQTVNAAPTTTVIASSVQPSITGQTVQLTATVTSTGTPVTVGQVTFRVGGASCADATTFAGPMSLDANGKATTSRTFRASGSPFVVRACYDGASQYASSEGSITQTVNPARIGLSTAVTPSTQQYSDQVVLSAQLGLESGALDGLTVTGTVNFTFAGVPAGSVTVNAATLPVSVTLVPSLPVNVPAGSYPVAAVFTSSNSSFTSGSATGAVATIVAENATVTPDPAFPTQTRVTSPFGTSGAITFAFAVSESSLETNADQSLVLPGDLTRTAARAVFTPAGGGAPITVSCTGGSVTGSGYGQVRPFTCASSGLPSANYQVALQLIPTSAGSYYVGSQTRAFRVYDPSAEVSALSEQVSPLVDKGLLKPGNANALCMKLNEVIAKIGRQDDNAAINQLGAFMNQVQALKLPAAVSDQLIHAAQAIVADLSK